MSDGRNKFVVATVALLMVATLGFWLLREEPTVVACQAPGPTAPAPSAPADSASLPAATPAPERTEAPAAAPVAPVVDPLLAHVRGRCVDETGAPLAGCTASFDAWGGNSNRMAMQGKVDWKDPEPIVTREDGRFDFGFTPPSGMQFSLDVIADGRVPRTGRWSSIQPAQIVDLGDIAFAPGFAVRGRVVDEQGVPVASVGVSLDNLPLPIAPGMGANDTRYGPCDQDGNFRIEVPIPPGTWSLDVQSRGMRLVSPDRVVVTERGAEPVLVTVRRMPSIEGIVVDEHGLPVKGVGVQAELDRSGRMASGRTRDDGTFTIHAVDAEPKPVKLRIDDPGPCEPPAPDERVWEWGSKDVRFELRRALSCELTVVERGSGAAVTQYALSCYGSASNSSLFSDLRLSGEHLDGRVNVDRIWRGKNFLRVMPIDRALQPSAVIEFEASDAGVPPMRIELDRLLPATVRVVSANGTPFVGSKVEVIVKGTRPFDADASAQDSRGGNRAWSSDPKFRAHELVSSAVTGVDGRAPMFLPPDGKDLVVRATGGHAPALVDPAIFLLGADLVVVPVATGSIVGIVHLAGLEPSRISIAARSVAAQRKGREVRMTLQGDGRFALRDLAPGHYQLRLGYTLRFLTGHGSSGSTAELAVQIPEVTVEAERETPIDIDATAIVPATVRGRVLLDGVPPSPARVFLRAERGSTFGQFVPGPDGTFEAAELLPGTYRIGLVVGDFQAGEGDTILQDDTFVLGPGQQHVSDFVFLRRRLVVTLLQTDGKTPAAGVQCHCNGDSTFASKTTDKDGKLVFDPAPTGVLWIQPTPGQTRLGPVQIPTGQTQHEVTFTLPATTAAK